MKGDIWHAEFFKCYHQEVIRNMDDQKLKTIGKKIKEYRFANKLTQNDLANKLGMSTRQIGEIETGNSLSSIDVLFDISNILNIPIDLLFTGCDRKFLVYAIDDYLNLIDKNKSASTLSEIMNLME